MPKFLVEYQVKEPTWGDLELESDTPQLAESNAFEILEMRFPQGIDLEITSVQELNAN